MKIVISIVLAGLFLVGCGDSASETQVVEPTQVVSEVKEPVAPQNTDAAVVQESNVSAPAAEEPAPVAPVETK
jgi:uncharacterized protein YcfL